MCAEWYFRSGLDRYVWIYGMLLAWLHPHLEALWEAIEKLAPPQRNLARATIFGSASAVLYVWCVAYIVPCRRCKFDSEIVNFCI